ncbi:pyridoxamine 5'-phosphate oxidase-related FMN-binding protein [Pseudodesulfovibrio mercurii]|uniref:Pyridoxamine 5'-phosphate oxidase-related FMN-binding protein n=1 Tax=Pseudodesulfovibrio mercurii TaxID=641491 RepID=F0JJU4_9BACT|nr:pyridoxamine 5'-phosphate oxidase family protein [Pseudodesulfovibrio mercurii]EGB16193.1 pyridoxamine 5'-phosphate oxidase-related FMN-binding protein [Pseudodesulfovibrio mercurii]
MSKEKMHLIDDLITGEETCVLATTDGVRLHCSLMRFFADHAAMKFYFLSPASSQKNRNMREHPHVCLMIDRRDQDLALSIQGVYSPIRKRQTAEAITRLFLMKFPQMAELAANPDVELIRVDGRSATLSGGPEDNFTTKLKNS